MRPKECTRRFVTAVATVLFSLVSAAVPQVATSEAVEVGNVAKNRSFIRVALTQFDNLCREYGYNPILCSCDDRGCAAQLPDGGEVAFRVVSNDSCVMAWRSDGHGETAEYTSASVSAEEEAYDDLAWAVREATKDVKAWCAAMGHGDAC